MFIASVLNRLGYVHGGKAYYQGNIRSTKAGNNVFHLLCHKLHCYNCIHYIKCPTFTGIVLLEPTPSVPHSSLKGKSSFMK